MGTTSSSGTIAKTALTTTKSVGFGHSSSSASMSPPLSPALDLAETTGQLKGEQTVDLEMNWSAFQNMISEVDTIPTSKRQKTVEHQSRQRGRRVEGKDVGAFWSNSVPRLVLKTSTAIAVNDATRNSSSFDKSRKRQNSSHNVDRTIDTVTRRCTSRDGSDSLV